MRTKYSYNKKNYKYNFGNPNVFVIRERENPKLIKYYDQKIQEIFLCKIHGKHSEWQRTSAKSKYGIWGYLVCKKCKRQDARLHYKTNPIYHLLKSTKNHAKDRKLNVEINEKDIEDRIRFQKNMCGYTKIKFDNKNNKPSIDRINSNKGYLKNNIRMLIYDVNRMKSDLKEDNFLKLCKLITNPKKNKASYELLKNAKKSRSREELIELKNKFLKNKKALCFIHGNHGNWEVFFNGRFTSIRCKKCISDNPKKKIKTIYTNEKLQEFKQKKYMLCSKHGLHKNFLITLDKRTNKEGLRCKLCQMEIKKKTQKNNIFSYIFSNTKRISRNYKIFMDLTYEQLLQKYIKQGGRCRYTNITFNEINKPSIDKINPKMGYTLKNINLVLYNVNVIKSDFSEKRFKYLCRKISNNIS